MLKNIRKNLEQKKSENLKKFILAGIMAGGLLYQNSVALAEEEHVEDENIDNPYAYNTIEVDEDQIDFNGYTYENSEGYSVTFEDKEGTGNVTYNKLTINGNENGIEIEGGKYSGNFTFNEITLNGGIFKLYINDETAYNGTFANNTFNINGGTFYNEYKKLYHSSAENNTMNISGSPDISEAYLFGGIIGDFENASDNTLNINTSGLTARNIYGFDTINFNLPTTIQRGNTILTLTDGSTDLSNVDVNANIFGGTNLNSGDTVNLLNNVNGLTYGGSGTVNIEEGSTLSYENSTIKQDGENLVLTLGTPQVNEETKSFSQGVLNTSATLSRGTERIIDWLPPEELEDAVAEGASISEYVSKNFGIFANMEASKLRIKTGAGSYIDAKGGGMDLGLARAVEDSHGGSFVFAPLVDYGKTRFDSYLADGTHGNGHSRYFAGGFIGRKIWNNGFYLEGSFRAGSSKTDFASDDLFSSYSESTPVLAGHIRTGRLWRMNRNNLLHVYGIYAHNHVNGFGADLSSGEHYDFDSVDSGKFKVGYRLTTRVSNLSKLYTGLAYQYEFNGSTSARYKGYTTTEAEVKGSSGMLELGWQMHNQKESAWLVDFNVTGWIGIQKGVTGSAKIKKSF